jgi:hypothetical protein
MATLQGQMISTTMKQVSIGSSVIRGVDAQGKIYRIWKDGTTWTQTGIPGELAQISVAADNTIWGVGMNGSIYRHTGDMSIGNGWAHVPGELQQVSVGSNSQVWGVTQGQTIYRYTGIGNGWEEIPGQLCSVDVPPDGDVWGVGLKKDCLYRYDSDGDPATAWTQFPRNMGSNYFGPRDFIQVTKTVAPDCLFALTSYGTILQYKWTSGSLDANPWHSCDFPPATCFSAVAYGDGVRVLVVLVDMQGRTFFYCVIPFSD